MTKKIQGFIEERGLPSPESLTGKQIQEFEKAALECIDGWGDVYEVMASVVVLAEALKLERAKSGSASSK